MIVLVPAWMVLVGLALRALWRVAGLLAEMALVALWLAGVLLASLGSLFAAVYRSGRRGANPFYDQLREIRGLPEARGWLRRTVLHR